MNLAVRIAGAGPDLALIHGWAFPGEVWAPLVAPLAEQFRVHCVDLPGYGDSRALRHGTLDEIADQVMAVLPERVTLCGWSLGAQIALAAALRHGERVRDLVLVAATPCFVRRADWPDAVDSRFLGLFADTLERSPASVLGRFATLVNQGDSEARRITPALLALLRRPAETSALVAGLRLLAEIDLRQALPRVRPPVLLIHGASDPLMPIAAARSLAGALPAAELATFAGAAHAPFLSQPDEFVARLADFALARAYGTALSC